MPIWQDPSTRALRGHDVPYESQLPGLRRNDLGGEVTHSSLSPESSLSQGSLSSERSLQQQEGITLYPLDMFIVNEDIDGVRLKLEQLKQQGELIDRDSLSLAITNGHIDIVKILLKHIKSFNDRENQLELYRSALKKAVENHEVNMIAAILDFYNFTSFLDEKSRIISEIVKLDKSELETFLNFHTVDIIEIRKHVLDGSNVLSKIPEDSIRLAADFEDRLKRNDTMQRFCDVYSSEFITDPIYFLGNEAVVFEKNSIESAIASLELAKTNYEKLRKLQIELHFGSDNAKYQFQQIIAYLQRDNAFTKHIEETGSQVLGNCTVRDIINLDLEKLKQIFEAMGLMDVVINLNIIIDYMNRNAGLSLPPTYLGYIYQVAVLVLNNLIAQVESITKESANDVLRDPTNRKPLNLENLKSARLFMDVYLVAMHRFRQQQPDKYKEWRNRQIDKDKDYLEALETAINELTGDRECKGRFTAATKSLEICAKYYAQKPTTQETIGQEELKKLIEESGLTSNQLKILNTDGIIQLTVPEERASVIELARRRRRGQV